jgi:hypothetical protein
MLYNDDQVARMLFRFMVKANDLLAVKDERIRQLEADLEFANDCLDKAATYLAGG